MTAPGGGFFERFLAPESASISPSLIPPDVLKRIGRRGLIDTGLGIMAAAEESGAGLGSSLAKGVQFGRENYRQGVKDAAENSLTSRKVGEVDRLTKLRSDIAAKYPAKEGETTAQRIERITNAAYEYANGGDTETAAKLAQVANSLRLSAQGGATPYTYLQKNGRIYKINKQSGEVSVINDDGSLEARQELAEANRALREQSLGLSTERNDMSRERLALAQQAAGRAGADERKTRLQYQTALAVLPVLDAAPAVGAVNWAGDRFGVGEAVDGEQQKINAAGAAFMNAWVRENSGAATSKEDWEVIARGYLPARGDKPGTLKFKKYQRDQFMAALRNKMARGGSGLDPFTPDSGTRSTGNPLFDEE